MPKLNRIYLINAAGFDEVEFPVGGHCQIFGGNGHGKSTLLRAILFFYLGTNDKAPYSLDETKKDLVSYYLGNPPSYLIYEVIRGEGQPSFQIAVTRPAGKIQFHFVDAPYRRDYFVDGQMALPIEDVQRRWREGKCAVETFSSYDQFNHRIYGIIPLTLCGVDALHAAQSRVISEFDAFEKRVAQTVNTLQTRITAHGEARSKACDEGVRWENTLVNLRSQFTANKDRRRDDLEKREATWNEANDLLQKEAGETEATFRERFKDLDEEFKSRKSAAASDQAEQRSAIDREEATAEETRDKELARIERESRARLAAEGAEAAQIAAAQKRASDAESEIKRISGFIDEVAVYRQKKLDWIDRLPGWQSDCKSRKESLRAQESVREKVMARHRAALDAFDKRRIQIEEATAGVEKDEEAVSRFRNDPRFIRESGYFEREDLPPAAFHRAGAARELFSLAEQAHQSREEIDKNGNKAAKTFLNHFDPETLDRKVLGFSPPHDYFDWFIFVGSELKPFVNHHGIGGLKRTQTQQFEQLIRNICNKNAAFDAGIRQVRQTAESVQARLAETNFVDVLDSIELKVEHVDNQLTRTLASLEAFAGISFEQDHDLFGKRADQAQVDQAIEHFERLVKEIARYPTTQLSLTDYFEFLLRVQENGRDMGWRKSLNHIGSTGTDYLVKMLIYLALIEVYRERAIDPKVESTVHCVLDETGVLAPKYLRSVLDYAAARGIILVTAAHSQQSTGFEHWMFVRKVAMRFAGQQVLRKILRCD